MSVLGTWVLAPLVLAALCCGTGLLAERLAGLRLPGPLVPGVGLAGLVVVAGVPATWEATARLAVPLAAAAAVAGLALGAPWRDERLRRAAPWWLGAAAAAWALTAGPSLTSGQASVPGFLKLDDSVTWIVLGDWVLHHGRTLEDGAGSHAEVLRAWLAGGYPVGGFLPFASSALLSGQDPAGTYGPTLAVLVAVAALGLGACARPFVRSRAAAAAVGLVAVQASLFAGYVQWGGMKEAAVVALLGPLAWLVARGGARALALACVVAGALAGVLGVNAAAWTGPALAAGVVVSLRARPLLDRRSVLAAAGLAALLAACSAPALATLRFAAQTTAGQGGIRNEADLGNLAAPLRPLQAAGLWPVGDFRAVPDPLRVAELLAAACAALALLTAVAAVRRRAAPLVALLGISLAGALAAVVVGSAWVDAKAMAMLAPVVLLAAAALPARWLQGGTEVQWGIAAPLAVALGAGWSWSVAAVWRDVWVAPRDDLAELREVGQLLAGAGPVLQLDANLYGSRWFLRAAQGEGATDLRTRDVRRADGVAFPSFTTAEVDEVATGDLLPYRALVRRRSPVASRPPSGFHRLWAGASWEAWLRDPAAQVVPAPRLPLGDAGGPASVPPCEAVTALAQQAPGGVLAALPRRNPVLADLAAQLVPPPWRTPDGVRPTTDGSALVRVDVPFRDRWRIWVGGSVFGELTVRVDGREVGRVRHRLAYDGQWLRFGTAVLDPGSHVVELRFRRGPAWRGGRGAGPQQAPLGPLALSPSADERDVEPVRVAAGAARRLCDGRSFDWIEAVSP